jgi:hypothetical protein
VPAGTYEKESPMNIIAVYRNLMARRGPPRRAALAAIAVSFAALTSLAAPMAAGAAAGHDVPFNGSLGGVETTTSVDPGPPRVAHILGEWTGNASHLGRYTLENPHTVELASRNGIGTFAFTAANGDTVTGYVNGHADVLSGSPPAAVLSIVEHATITGGTGRFAGATGTFTVERIFDQTTGVTTGSFEGTISSPGAS